MASKIELFGPIFAIQGLVIFLDTLDGVQDLIISKKPSSENLQKSVAKVPGNVRIWGDFGIFQILFD